MNIQQELEALTHFLPLASLEQRVKFPMECLPESVLAVIPSIVLAVDGPALSALSLITENYLCEVKLAANHAHQFDVTDKARIMDYRINIWTHEIKENDIVKASYEVATIVLLHTLAAGSTTLSYAGTEGQERADWLRKVLEAIPIKLVLGYRTGAQTE